MTLFRRRREPDPSEIEIRHGDRAFAVTVRRREGAKRVGLRVSGATDEIVLTLPPGASLPAARIFAEAHGGWIAARLARLPLRTPFAPGAAIPVRGVPHRLVHRAGTRGAAALAVDADGAPILTIRCDPAAFAGRVQRFLAAEALRDLREAVARYTAALGVPARRIAVRDTVSRWGSCSSSGTLSFSWRLVMAPPLVLDYLAAHEVAHLRELNHSARFWSLLRELCPGTDDAERWLRRHGRDLHRIG